MKTILDHKLYMTTTEVLARDIVRTKDGDYFIPINAKDECLDIDNFQICCDDCGPLTIEQYSYHGLREDATEVSGMIIQ